MCGMKQTNQLIFLLGWTRELMKLFSPCDFSMDICLAISRDASGCIFNRL